MKIFFNNSYKEITLTNSCENSTLLHFLWNNNFYNNKYLCSGVGKCGKCKILFLSNPPAPTQDECGMLTQEEIDKGIRLSCKHSAKDEYILELIAEDAVFLEEESLFTSIIQQEKNAHIKTCLAIDFGTTSLEYSLISNCSQSIVYAHGKKMNPMQGVGSEVMARLEFAKNSDNAKELKHRTWALVGKIVNEARQNNYEVEQIVFSANSAMTYLALGKDSSCLATAPYFLNYNGGSVEHIDNLPPIFIPPLLAPFVGADIASGIFALKKQYDLEYPYLFIDMGTNAEFVLAFSETESILASVPLGPAVEGVGLTFGMLARHNSVVNFVLTPHGLKAQCLDPQTKEAQGICGVGYMHLLAILKKIAIIDNNGHFIIQENLDSIIPLTKKLARFSERSYGKHAVQCLELEHSLYLSAHDIEKILMVKAAFRASLEIMLDSANVQAQNLKNVYIAGAFGEHLRKEILTELEFLPALTQNKIQQVGNTSLQGAKLLCSAQNREEICSQITQFSHIELANHPDFSTQYIKHFNL